MSKLLLVDDDEDLCMVVSDKLLLEGHEVDVASNGSQAQKYLSGSSFDLLILDWDLPDTSGLEICKGFRAEGGVAPVLMLTGRTSIDHKEAGFDAGADDYLTKPFEMKELSMRVKALLKRAPANTAQPALASNVTGGWSLGPGSVIDGKYRLEEFIGQGGMALVYRATHIGMQKPVVLKLVQAHLLDDEISMQRFDLECRAMAKLTHGNVAAAFDNGFINNNQPYLVMEYVKGFSLAELIQSQAPLPVTAALEIAVQVCRGLEAAHKAGIIHRDLKPQNILLQDNPSDLNWVKIVDFGIAYMIDTQQRLTEPDLLMGSAGYVAPEVLRGNPLDVRVDIYALGIILFEMLTKQLPFQAANTQAFFIKQMIEAPAALSSQRKDIAAGSAVDAIVARALANNPNERFQTAQEFREALEKLLPLSNS